MLDPHGIRANFSSIRAFAERTMESDKKVSGIHTHSSRGVHPVRINEIEMIKGNVTFIFGRQFVESSLFLKLLQRFLETFLQFLVNHVSLNQIKVVHFLS